MKRNFLLSLSVLAIIVIAISVYTIQRRSHQEAKNFNQSQHQDPSHNKFPSTRIAVIPIDGMSCMACVSSVKKGLKNFEGVTEVEVSLEGHNAKVRYQTAKVTPELLARKINQLGYKSGTPIVENQE